MLTILISCSFLPLCLLFILFGFSSLCRPSLLLCNLYHFIPPSVLGNDISQLSRFKVQIIKPVFLAFFFFNKVYLSKTKVFILGSIPDQRWFTIPRPPTLVNYLFIFIFKHIYLLSTSNK